MTGVNFNTLAPPVVMGRHYKNISGCSVTLASFRGSDVKGIAMTSAVDVGLPAGNCHVPLPRRNDSVGAEGQITAFDGCNWNFTKDLSETKTRRRLSEADRLLSFLHSVIGLFLGGPFFSAADVLSGEIILPGAGVYRYKIWAAEEKKMKAASNKWVQWWKGVFKGRVPLNKLLLIGKKEGNLWVAGWARHSISTYRGFGKIRGNMRRLGFFCP